MVGGGAGDGKRGTGGDVERAVHATALPVHRARDFHDASHHATAAELDAAADGAGAAHGAGDDHLSGADRAAQAAAKDALLSGTRETGSAGDATAQPGQSRAAGRDKSAWGDAARTAEMHAPCLNLGETGVVVGRGLDPTGAGARGFAQRPRIVEGPRLAGGDVGLDIGGDLHHRACRVVEGAGQGARIGRLSQEITARPLRGAVVVNGAAVCQLVRRGHA